MESLRQGTRSSTTGSSEVEEGQRHASWEQVYAGQVEEVDKLGNDAADCLAVAGAALHGLPAEEAAQASIETVRWTHGGHTAEVKTTESCTHVRPITAGP